MSGSGLLSSIGLFLLGFVLLVAGAEFLVRGASRLAARFRVPEVVIGLTIVAFGTSLPELLVTVMANWRGGPGAEMAIGNIVGSNIANLGLILGIAGVLAACAVDRNVVWRDLPLLAGITIVFVVFAWDGSVGRLEGLVMLAGLAGYTYYKFAAARSGIDDEIEQLEAAEMLDDRIGRPSEQPWFDAGLIAVGLIGLAVGSDWLVESAQVLARAMGVSELVIGLTLVAIGTSLPEMATTLMAVARKNTDIAVGNLVGSNLFNLLFIGGLAAVIRPLPVPLGMRTPDFPLMLGVTLLAWVAAVVGRPYRIARWEGLLLVAVYVGYVVWLFAA